MADEKVRESVWIQGVQYAVHGPQIAEQVQKNMPAELNAYVSHSFGHVIVSADCYAPRLVGEVFKACSLASEPWGCSPKHQSPEADELARIYEVLSSIRKMIEPMTKPTVVVKERAPYSRGNVREEEESGAALLYSVPRSLYNEITLRAFHELYSTIRHIVTDECAQTITLKLLEFENKTRKRFVVVDD